ncbi:hypothetical protein [Streptomyces sp. MST-110588]|uniref:hypothetical protein n=1 Tax=Streptomyces sp. MST-110588 TaxID=2833628 RepID=UPI001F5D0CDE|nr:hypothetical protein [Streptomyces sp. MST-110588]UNO42432.1 hypothetical protein KGS77_26540 [Streptomyces sp. MST-110588]
MTCRDCAGGGKPIRLHAFTEGDPRAAILADRAADAERARGIGPVHIHYDQAADALIVVRTDPRPEVEAA